MACANSAILTRLTSYGSDGGKLRPTKSGLTGMWVLAGLAVRLVAAAVGAVLLQLEPVGVVPPVLAGDVVPVLALLAGQGDLGPDVGGSHARAFHRCGRTAEQHRKRCPCSRRPEAASGGPGGRPPGG